MKKLGFFIFGIIIGFILLLTNNILAASCGGAIQCNCGDTLNENQTMWYDLNNCSGDGLIINASDITLDCNGYLIDGDSIGYEHGILLYRKERVSIKNCNVREFYNGIFLTGSSNTLTNIIANYNNETGISIGSSLNISLTNIIANYNNNGIILDTSLNNTLTNIIANYNNGVGIFLNSGSNNILTNIAADYNNNNGIFLTGSSNTLANIIANYNNGAGIWLGSVSNNILTNIISNYNSYYGIYLESVSNNIFTNITANSNKYHGIYLYSSSNNTLSGNTANNNSRNGIYIWSGLNNTLLSNMFCSNNKSAGNYYDIYNTNSNSGDENTCDTTYNWNDTGTTGCTYSCPLPSVLITIPLNQNWNLISIPLVLENNSIENVFGSIMNKIIVINGFEAGPGGGAKTYDPLLPKFSDLYNIDYLHGYWVKMNESANLSVNGTTPENKTINLATGWNLISYLCDIPKNVSYVFSGIMSKVIVVNGFENGALTYDPKLPDFSDLKEMKPNLGYWVKMNQSAVLDYNSVC